ncbi:hypothetical protein BYT27DRAFT_7198159 [Phlegmacium glaucopus]|nr:hypothetical protein BYT27DRAFT_7198159 [Phlegmacium glaucopus]
MSVSRDKSGNISATDNSVTPEKHLKDWKVDSQHPYYLEPVFSNDKLEYHSYNPPQGFTAEEIFEFEGAKETLGTVEKVREIFEEGERFGTLDVTGDDIFKVSKSSS